jgi:two-component system chemotaxis sensor kinase CheA
VVTEAGGRPFCLMVDELIGKQEVVIKSLGDTMKDVRGIAGGAILGDGRVALILDVEGVFGAALDRGICDVGAGHSGASPPPRSVAQ